MRKTLIFVLLAAILLPILLAGCNTTPPTETTPENTTPGVYVPEDPWFQIPDYDGNGITADNALTCAFIVTGESENEVYAGEELAAYLTKKGVEIKEGGFPIIVCLDAMLENDAFSVDAILRGEEASMTIRGGNGRGVLYGVYKFLETYAGVRYFTYELEVIPTGDIVLRDGNLLAYKPYFEYRSTYWNCIYKDPAWCVKNGLNNNGDAMGGAIDYGGLFVHTLGKLTETGTNLSPNPCLSSEENYQKVINNLRAALKENPDADIVSVSQNDNPNYCTCEQCTAVNAEEGSPAGLMLRFVNRVAEELEADYPDLIIDTLAYNYTQHAPQKTVPRHNVCVRLCSIRCCFMHPLTECPDALGPNNYAWSKTSEFLYDLVEWGKICNNIYIWDYTTNYAYYVPPFSNFGAIRENMRFYHEHGTRGMYAQGNGQSTSGEFGELRAYLLAKLMWNPYMSEEEYYAHMDEFLEAYYGEGWEGIRAFIDLTTELVSNAGSCINIYEAPLNSITKEEYLEHEAQIEAWWNTAEERAGDRLEYVQRSRLQWRYIQLLLHPDAEACQQFIEDVQGYGIKWAESSNNNKTPDKMFPSLYPTQE